MVSHHNKLLDNSHHKVVHKCLVCPHFCNKFCVLLWGYAPHFFQVRLIFRFFKTLCIVVSDIVSIMLSRMILSAIICMVQRVFPFGGSLHAVAIMWASMSPVIFGSTGGVCLFLRFVILSSPCVMYCFLIRYTFSGWSLHFFAVCCGVRGLLLFVSRFRITFARVLHFWVAFLDCDLVKFCSSFLSSAVNFIVYFCDFIMLLRLVL